MASGPTITAKFLADTSALTSGVDKATGQAGSKLDSFAKNAAVAIGGAFAMQKVADFGKAAVQAAADDAEAQGQLAAALRNTTGATEAQIAASEDYIASLSKSAAIADDDLRPALATLARGFGDTEEAQRALSIATDVAAGTGKDLKTVTEAMAKAALGSTGALSKLGVATKDASGQALSMDQIMKNMAATFEGQASIAAESTAGQMRGAQIAMGELSESIGTALMPAIVLLAGVFTDTLLPALTWFTEHKVVMVAVAGAIAVAFGFWAAAAVIAAASTIAAVAPFVALGAAVAAAVYLIVTNWDKITGALKATFNWVKANWPLLLTILTGPIGAAVWVIEAHWDKIKAAATAVFEWVRAKWDAIGAAIGAVIGTITGYVNTIVTQIKRPIAAATEVFNWVRDKFNAIASAIAGVVGSIRDSIAKIVSSIRGPMNVLIRGWNAIQFTIPRVSIPKVHIPGTDIDIGGGSFGGQSFGTKDITPLARGGVLTGPTLFLGGEAGTEIVTPETLLRQIMREEGGAGASYVLNIYPRQVDAADLAYAFRRLELMAGR